MILVTQLRDVIFGFFKKLCYALRLILPYSIVKFILGPTYQFEQALLSSDVGNEEEIIYNCVAAIYAYPSPWKNITLRHGMSGVGGTVFGINFHKRRPWTLDDIVTIPLEEMFDSMRDRINIPLTARRRMEDNLMLFCRAWNGRQASIALTSSVASVSFKKECESHNILLDTLWNTFKGLDSTWIDCPTKSQYASTVRRSDSAGRDWNELGFQRPDAPESDFRSAGMLGLLQMISLFEDRYQFASRVLLKTDLPYRGYPLALASLKMTVWLLQLGTQGHLDAYYFQTREFPEMTAVGFTVAEDMCANDKYHWIQAILSGYGKITNEAMSVQPQALKLFNLLHGILMERYDHYWESKHPDSILEFETLWTSFTKEVSDELISRGPLGLVQFTAAEANALLNNDISS